MASSITSTGSNFDVDSLVTALMKQHQAKVQKVENEKKSYEVKLTNLGKVKSAVEDIQSTVKSLDNSTASGMTVEKIKTTLKEFVQDYNSTRQTTKESTDISVKSFPQRLRATLDPIVATQLGLSFDKTGQAVFNEAKFDAAAANETSLRSSVSGLFDKSLASGSSFDTLLRSNGVIDYSETLLQRKVSTLDKKVDTMQTQMETYEKNYRKQFNALDIYLGQMNNNQSTINKIDYTA